MAFSKGRYGPRVRTSGVLVERVDDDLVVYDERAKRAHCLSRDASQVWNVCDGRHSRKEIARRAGVEPATVERAIEEFRNAGLLDEKRISRRDAAKRFATVGGAAMAGPLLYSVAVPPAFAACSPYGCFLNIAFNDFSNTETTPTAAGYLWLEAHGTSQTLPSGTKIFITNQTIDFPAATTGITAAPIPLPDSIITFQTGATASATFDSANNRWLITQPPNSSNDWFMGGLLISHAQQITSSGNIVWSGKVSIPGQTNPPDFSWQWSSRDYPNPPTMSMTTITVQAGGSSAGDITNFTRRNGGSNGSNSATATCATVCPIA